MKTLKLLTSAILMPVLSVILFQSCAEEMAPELQLNREAIETLQTKSMDDAPAPEFAPLGVVPDWAKAKMTDEEMEMWMEISQYYYVDYSFIDQYQVNRSSINRNANIIRQEICEDKIKEKGTQLILVPLHLQHNQIEKLSSSEQEGVGNENIRVTLYEQSGVTIIYTAHVSYLAHQGKLLEANLRSSAFIMTPSHVSFSGTKGSYVDLLGNLYVYMIGDIIQGSVRQEIDINTSIRFYEVKN